jgi:hypothetical protein
VTGDAYSKHYFVMTDDLAIQLKELFLERKRKNIRYSLRAFARDLKVPVSCISRAFNGHTKLGTINRVIIKNSLEGRSSV